MIRPGYTLLSLYARMAAYILAVCYIGFISRIHMIFLCDYSHDYLMLMCTLFGVIILHLYMRLIMRGLYPKRDLSFTEVCLVMMTFFYFLRFSRYDF